jgi:hypothetical protein
MRPKLLALILALFIVACDGASIEDVRPAELPADSWLILDPRDPSLPELIIPAGESYRLNPNWQVASLEYALLHLGYPSGWFDHQRLERDGDSFRWGTTVVDNVTIQALLAGMRDLHPTANTLAGPTGADNYTRMTLEITGVNGEQVLLFYQTGRSPWNVLYNGRLYVQHSQAVVEPLAALLATQPALPATSLFRVDHSEDPVVFSTINQPPQLRYGFTGLLYVADNFHYQTEAETATIQGYVESRSSHGRSLSNAIIAGLHRVELTRPDGSVTSCPIEEMYISELRQTQWHFTCVLGRSSMSGHYEYPVRLFIEAAESEIVEVEGVLQGLWHSEAAAMIVPPPAKLASAFADHDLIQDLLVDHTLAQIDYAARIEADNPAAGTFVGEAVLLGQTGRPGSITRYTIATPFAVEDGVVTTWNLTRSALNEMIAEIEALPLTRRVVAAAPNAVVNLWYAEWERLPAIGNDHLFTNQPTNYTITLLPCGSFPGQSFPGSSRPLRAFSFNDDWLFWGPDFALVDGTAIVADLDLWPARDDRNGVLDVLLPAAFDTGNTRPFERVTIENDSDSRRTPALTLWIPSDIEPADRATYNRIVDSMPVPEGTAMIGGTTENITFVVTEEGTLEVAGCD